MLRFGLFGAGRIGRVHAASVAMHPRAELAVVYDPVEPAAREVAAQYGAAPTGDAETILGDPEHRRRHHRLADADPRGTC